MKEPLSLLFDRYYKDNVIVIPGHFKRKFDAVL